jgi:hypothetical protein
MGDAGGTPKLWFSWFLMVTLADSMALSQRPYEALHPPLRPCLVYPADLLKWAVPADLRAHKGVPGKVCVAALWPYGPSEESPYTPATPQGAVRR